jgi:hypothetical protein
MIQGTIIHNMPKILKGSSVGYYQPSCSHLSNLLIIRIQFFGIEIWKTSQNHFHINFTRSVFKLMNFFRYPAGQIFRKVCIRIHFSTLNSDQFPKLEIRIASKTFL